MTMSRSTLNTAAIALAAAGVLAAAATLPVFLTWRAENAGLKAIGLAQTAGQPTRAAKVIALTNWVYHHQGFAKNERYFVFPKLGASPTQILESGGDCADKSRLLSAILDQIGIGSTLVMLYPCADCGPVHTLVEADYEGGKMVTDPIWNVDYPAEGGKYYGVADLRGNQRAASRISQLQLERGPHSKIAGYPEQETIYDFSRGVNWSKIPLVTPVAKAIGVDLSLLKRPQMLEDPGQLISVGGFGTAALLLVAAGGLARRARRRPAAAPPSAA